VILVDINLLLYAHIARYPDHRKIQDWLDRRLNGVERVGLPWASLLGFVRLATNPRAQERPLVVREAWEQVRAWLSNDTAWIPQPTERHADVLGELLSIPGINANLIPDAHLAALAVEHGLTLCSADGDFARFPALRWHNPLIG
jgi:toxin-antitoxin system PIN domain toxin